MFIFQHFRIQNRYKKNVRLLQRKERADIIHAVRDELFFHQDKTIN